MDPRIPIWTQTLGAGLQALAPEGMLVLALLLTLALAALPPRFRAAAPWALWACTAAGIAWLLGHWPPADAAPLWAGMARSDAASAYARLLILAALAVAAFLYRSSAQMSPETSALLATLALGAMLLSQASHLLMLYLSLELSSLPAYLLTARRRRRRDAAEASVKYALFGAFASGMMVYGISWLYGITGSLEPADPEFVRRLSEAPPALLAAPVLLLLSGLLFKAGAAPMHFWAPDAYQGAPLPVAALFSIAPKAGAMLALMRLLDGWEGAASLPLVRGLLGAAALLSMTLGNFAALGQTDVRRLLAYSGIAHAGYMLLGVLTGALSGRVSVGLYLGAYLLMNLGAFAWAARARQLSGSFRITAWQGLARSHPLLAAGFTVCLVSLAGLPPTGGFIAKWYVFLALVEQIRLSWDSFLLLLLVAGVLNTLISFIYYLRIPAQMVFREAPPEGWKPARGTGLAAAGTALAALSLLSGMAGFDTLLGALAAWLWN